MEKGIIPEITEDQLLEIVDQVIEEHHNKPIQDRDLDELDELIDDDLEDSRILE
jgi:hypothetical protein